MKYVLTGTPLCPGDAKEMAAVESAISVEYSYFTPAFMPVYVERMLKKKKGLEADETKVAAAIEKLTGDTCTALGNSLGSVGRYFGGDEMSPQSCTNIIPHEPQSQPRVTSKSSQIHPSSCLAHVAITSTHRFSSRMRRLS